MAIDTTQIKEINIPAQFNSAKAVLKTFPSSLMMKAAKRA